MIKYRSFFFILVFTSLTFIMCSSGTNHKDIKNSKVISNDSNDLVKDCNAFNALYIQIRDGLIQKELAKKQLADLLNNIKNELNNHENTKVGKADWVFPVEGYDANSIGGVNGNGFVLGAWDFYDGNKHTGHPAQDIFIKDDNQDCIDDITKTPVNILSMTAGIVVATEPEWNSESLLRGGKYILIFDATNNMLIYYAHNNKVIVKPGQQLKQGDKIAEMGRSGLNAFKKRSPTHLHFMCLKVEQGGVLVALNVFDELKKMKSIK